MTDNVNLIAAAIAEAEVINVSAPRDASQKKPRLLVQSSDPDQTVAALRNILADAGLLFDRGVPVRLTFDQIQGGAAAQIMSPDGLVLMAHTVCRPYALKQHKDGTIKAINVRLPRAFAVMYLDWRGEWRLPLLNGIASAPLLREDGTIFCSQGYDPPSGMWLENVPDLADAIPDHPTRGQAQAGLHLLRETFKTFCFADAPSHFDTATGLSVVDTNMPPCRDESAFLVGLLTAVCRPSLHLAPGILLRAAPLSGAGAGKGLLARCISIIAFGHEPYAVTGGTNAEELEKRIASELIAGGSALFLDNMNNTALKSDLLASAITERPARVRVLGRSQMVPLNASAFIVLTGNGLTVSEDLARRFIAIEFDPGTEDPESRPFTIDIRAVVKARRQELLSALLTIWRWGRLERVPAGKALGSFEQWSRWVRDPLLALGCQDPVERISEAKERDSRRQSVSDLFSAWWACHEDKPVAIRDLAERVKEVADPQGRGRQYLAAHFERLAGTRAAGFILTRQAPVGTWGAATFSLRRAEDHRGDRGHRDSLDVHGPGNGHMDGPMPPMPPMPSSSPAANGAGGPDHRRSWRTRL